MRRFKVAHGENEVWDSVTQAKSEFDMSGEEATELVHAMNIEEDKAVNPNESLCRGFKAIR